MDERGGNKAGSDRCCVGALISENKQILPCEHELGCSSFGIDELGTINFRSNMEERQCLEDVEVLNTHQFSSRRSSLGYHITPNIKSSFCYLNSGSPIQSGSTTQLLSSPLLSGFKTPSFLFSVCSWPKSKCPSIPLTLSSFA
jgi:hypothetical protein